VASEEDNSCSDRSWPTLDLHCHLRGVMPPCDAERLAQRHGLQLPKSISLAGYVFSNFDEFLALYDRVGHVIREAEDLREIAYRYLSTVSEEGTVYVEFMISPGHSIVNGIPFLCQISAISDAIEQAKDELGILSCIVITCVRHRGGDEAVDVAEMAASARSRHVRGFGLTGNERAFRVQEFQGAFRIAEAAGLGLTAHTGEWLDGPSVLEAVDTLRLQRVGHGISVYRHHDIMSELSERGIGFEICLSSNFSLGACDVSDAHPALTMMENNCLVSFCTDDPAYFNATPASELRLAVRCLGLLDKDIKQVLNNSVDMAFCPENVKDLLRSEFRSLPL